MNTNQTEQTANIQNMQTMAMAANLIQYRLDTSPELERIYFFLSGTTRMYDEEQEKTIVKRTGDSKANELGTSNLMNFLNLFLNKHVIMGNLKEDHYRSIVARLRMEFTYEIIRNRYRYAIKDEDSQSIIDFIMSNIELYLTRAINDGERESFKTQYRTSEVITNKDTRTNVLESFAKGFGKT